MTENQDCISVTNNQNCISVTEVLTTWAEFIITDHSQAGSCFSVEYSQIEGTGHYLSSEGGRGGGGRDEGDEDYGCVTIRFTWSPHQALLYSNYPLHQKSVFYSPLPLNSVKRLLMPLCSPWTNVTPPNKKKSPDSTLLRRKIKTAPKFFLPFSVEKMNNFLSLKTQCFSVWVVHNINNALGWVHQAYLNCNKYGFPFIKITYWAGQLVIHNE